jgi:translation initiation factor IF-2
MRCASMLEKAKELAVVLAFDVPVDKEAERLAEELGIKIFKGTTNFMIHPTIKSDVERCSGHHLPPL